MPLEGGKELPEYVEQVGRSLKQAYDKLHHSLEEGHKANKARYDKRQSGCNFTVGDLVWLYVPAIKTGRTKKFSCLWKGPYTVVDKTSAVNYRIQLLGSSKMTIVHRNRLKTCFGRPQLKSVTKANKEVMRDDHCTDRSDTVLRKAPDKTTRSYADVTATTPVKSLPAGYTSSNDIGIHSRPQRTCRPPDFYRP